MKFYNRIDEQNRFVGLVVTNESPGQVDTHTISYYGARNLYKECGDVMGLEKTQVINNEYRPML